ncbi:hypothetical protein HC891_12790 [Candidatus Gracilibacteria bacterium]|nr:hypothetical protein [Candidatus Gracilibacteria bacterium]
MPRMIGAAVQRRRRDGSRIERDYALMRAAGVEWVRMGFRTPFADATLRQLTSEFRDQEHEVELLRAHGFKLMGYTPFPGGDLDIGGGFSAWGGPMGSAGYYALYEEVCAWLAERFRDVASAWQVANELNAPDWNGGLTAEQSVTFLLQGARGVKRGNPNALVGVNMAGFDERALWMYQQLFPNDVVALDYIGADGYFGSYNEGGPEHWREKLDQLHAIAGLPIVVQEFGYPSAGGTMRDPAQRREHQRFRCVERAWPYSWEERPRDATTQAEYIERCMTIFAADPRVIGVFVWRWNDGGRCWLCGSPDCPITGNWGLVDIDERTKPAYYAFQRGAVRLHQGDSPDVY